MSHSSDAFLDSEAALEALAAVAHDRWSHWQEYLHNQCERLDDGSIRIPQQLVDRWERQIATTYAHLDDDERESDREQAREYLSALRRTSLDWNG